MRSTIGDWIVGHSRLTFVTAMGLVVVAGLLAAAIALNASRAQGLVDEAFVVRAAARDLLEIAQDAETGQRGFLLTQERSYLEPFNSAEARVGSTIAQLKALVLNSPHIYQRVEQIDQLMHAKLEELQQTIALVETGRPDAAIDIVRADTGKALMDNIRSEVGSLVDEQYSLLLVRQDAAETLRRWMLVLVAISLTLALAVSGFLVFYSQHFISELRDRTRELEAEARRRAVAEETLRQSQKMEAVGQLTGGIAHDFNNLLTVIMGNLDTLRRRLGQAPADQTLAGIADRILKPLESASQASRSAAQLTHQLLAFARKQPLKPVAIDLNRLISNMSEMLRRTLGEPISIETVLGGGLWPALADANQLENALINLALNARDAMANGGCLTIETANAYLDDAYVARFGDVAAGQYVILSVTDTGTGIDPAVLEHVFEPFFTTKQAGSGSGLGLAMVHGFVKQSGGHIRIYSEIGHGTTVKIYLPRLASATTVASVPAERAESATVRRARPQESIMLVEDNDGVRDYARGALEELGYSVLAARDGTEALRIIDGARVDLLFTDVVLPGNVGGRVLADKILELRPGLPVLFTTGYTRNAIVHDGRLDPHVQLLGKPYTQQDLARKIREMIDQKTDG
jgi:signal transduction histidine kinase/ActR/RegA family two-component response regulator